MYNKTCGFYDIICIFSSLPVLKMPYRYFKDTLNYTGLDEAYYAFRFLAHIEIARNWCEENEVLYIMYTDKRGKEKLVVACIE